MDGTPIMGGQLTKSQILQTEAKRLAQLQVCHLKMLGKWKVVNVFYDRSQQQFQLDLHLGSKKAQPKEWPGVPSPAFQFVKDHSLPSVQLQLKLIKLYRSIFAFEVLNHSPTSQYLHSSVHHTEPQSNTSATHSQCPSVSRR